ncbi:uncharacterized protein JCM6883_003188 [Sporobolomyces salmoneus]|uniref:uncharacterized protein n=1 Tax=Sporobolomyces salmoneus TaxID=183962 RepID=UPI0031707512
MSQRTESIKDGTTTLPDGTHLSYSVHFPLDQSTLAKLALVAHPFGRLGGSKNDHMVQSLSRMLCKEGYIVVRFDCRGAGESEGKASWTGSTEVEDFQAVFNSILLPLLPTQSPSEPQQSVELLLCGYSFGSLLASACPPPVSTSQYSFKTRYLLLSYPLSVTFALTFFNSSKFAKMLEDRIKENNEVCVTYGDGDQFSRVEKFRKWSEGLVKLGERPDQVRVIEVEGADHFWARRNDKMEALERIRAWSSSSSRESKRDQVTNAPPRSAQATRSNLTQSP